MSKEVIKEEIHLEHSSLRYPLPEGLLKELAMELPLINEYPGGGEYRLLRTELARYTGTSCGSVLPANGSDEVIEAVTRAFGKKLILIPVPTFSQYEVSADRNGFTKKLVTSLKGCNYQLDYTADDLKKASLVWICNPNNPTGNVIPRKDIIKVLNLTSGIVAVDECNYEYTGETVVDLLGQYPHLVICRSFSKNFGLAGLRLGFALSSLKNIHEIAGYLQVFRVNKMAETAGIKVLKYLDYFQEIWQEIALVRENFVSGLRDLGVKTFTSRTNFVLADFCTEENAKIVWQYLQSENIFSCPSWGEECTGLENHYLRFTIGTNKEMNLVLELLAGILK